MSNGKGTISCFYCKHYSRDWWCGLYSIELPSDKVGTDNPICVDFAESEDSSAVFGLHGQLVQLQSGMRQGILYGFPYPSRTPVADLREVAKLTKYV